MTTSSRTSTCSSRRRSRSAPPRGAGRPPRGTRPACRRARAGVICAPSGACCRVRRAPCVSSSGSSRPRAADGGVVVPGVNRSTGAADQHAGRVAHGAGRCRAGHGRRDGRAAHRSGALRHHGDPAAAAAPPVLVGRCGPERPGVTVRGAGCSSPARARRRASAQGRRRTWQQRRNPAAAPSTCSPSWPRWRWSGSDWRASISRGLELAVRQGTIAGGGVLALAAFWRFRVRLLGVLGIAAYGTSVLLLAAVLGVDRHLGERGDAVDRGRADELPAVRLAKLGLLLVLAGVLGSGRPEWQRCSLASRCQVPIPLTFVQPDLSTTTLLAVLAGSMLVIGRCRCGSSCRWSPPRPCRHR